MMSTDNNDEPASPLANGNSKQTPEPARWASIADRLNPNRAAFDVDFQSKWKGMSKADRKRLLAEDKAKIIALKSRGSETLPFEAEEEDHCETSPTAYSHIVPFLNLVAEKLNKDQSQLQIYDPYYCAGSIRTHMQALGFPQVHNIAEDFYQTISEERIPGHDVVVTNPPYSGDHFERLLAFLEANSKPFLLLLPSHFSQRIAYKQATNLTKELVFLTPPERYHYWVPEGRRPKTDSKKKRTHRNLHLGSRNSPFASHWFVSLVPLVSRKKLLKLYSKKKKKKRLLLAEGCTLHGNTVSLEKADKVFKKKKKNDSRNDRQEESILQDKKRLRNV